MGAQPQLGSLAVQARQVVAHDQDGVELERLRVREHIAFLNQLPRLVDPGLPEAQRQRVRERTRAAKLQLMQVVWREDWGAFDDFRVWAEGGSAAIQSEAFRQAATFFAYGQEAPDE